MIRAPAERGETVRASIAAALRGPALSARELSELVRIAEREVADHLAHLEKSAKAQGERLVIQACLLQGLWLHLRGAGASRPAQPVPRMQERAARRAALSHRVSGPSSGPNGAGPTRPAGAIVRPLMKTALPLLFAAFLSLSACEQKPVEPAPTPSAVPALTSASAIASAPAIASASAAPSAEAPAADAAAPGDGGEGANADAGAAKKPAAPEHGVKLIPARRRAAPEAPLQVRGRSHRLARDDHHQQHEDGDGWAGRGRAEPAGGASGRRADREEVTADGSAKRALVLEDVGLMPGPGLSKSSATRPRRT